MNPFGFKNNSEMKRLGRIVPLKRTMPKSILHFVRGFTRDSDKDGFPNVIDCSPFNSRKQGLNLMQKEQFRKLPIYVGGTPLREKPKITQRFVEGIYKTYPSLLALHSKTQTPVDFYYPTTKEKKEKLRGFYSPSDNSEKGKGEITVLVHRDSTNLGTKINTAQTISHELTHATQKQEGRMFFKYKKGYRNEPIEREARQKSENMIRERGDVLVKHAKQILAEKYKHYSVPYGEEVEIPRKQISQAVEEKENRDAAKQQKTMAYAAEQKEYNNSEVSESVNLAEYQGGQ